MAKRIDHRDVKFPAPTKSLLEGMAVAGHAAFANTIVLEIDATITDWDETNEHIRIAWYDAAKSMYAMLAIAAGAKTTEVPEKEKPENKQGDDK